MADNKKIDQMIEGYKEIVANLEAAKDGTPEEQHAAMTNTLRDSSGYCCGSCVAVSNFCVPDNTPNKCNGGCTVTSFAF